MIGVFNEILFSLTNLIFLFAVLGWIFLTIEKTKKMGKFFILISLICFYLFSIAPIGNLMIKPLENKYSLCRLNSPVINRLDTVVVLAGGVRSEKLPLISAISGSTLIRVVKSITLYNHDPKLKIIVSGDECTAEKIKLFLINFKIPEDNIIIDGNSHNTLQNAQNVKKIIGNNQFILVTSAFHMPRAMSSFKKLGMNPYPYPTDFRGDNSYNPWDFLPNTKNLHKSNLAFHEYVGKIFYSLYVH